MNKESHFYYQHVYGDKETFHLSWMALKTPYFMIQQILGIVQNMKFKRITPDFKRGAFLQRDLLGDPLFCHHSFYKWADREDESFVLLYFTLPDYHISNTLNWDMMNASSKKHEFQHHFPDFEMRCLKYMEEARAKIK